MSFFEDVYTVVSRIPQGKVVTYGQVARAVGSRDARRVGQALHGNKDTSRVPCHRVVFADGSMAPGYAFGGPKKQREILEKEGVVFTGEKVNLQVSGTEL